MAKLDEVVDRPRAYWSEDGVPDLMLGLNFLIVGVLFLILFVLPKGSSLAKSYIWAAQAGWLCCSLGMSWGIKSLKERVTAPRGGYVALREPAAKMRMSKWSLWVLTFAASGLIGFIAIVLRTGVAGWERFAIPLVAIVFALTLAVPGWRYKLPHMQWLGAFSLLLGVCVYRLHHGIGESVCEMMIGLGIAMTLAGAVRLWNFLASHPLTGSE
jgi:hypothetical protein